MTAIGTDPMRLSSSISARITHTDTSIYRIPTDYPESDGSHGLHLPEVLQMVLRPDEPPRMYPEKNFVEPRIAVQKRLMLRTAAILG